MPTLRSSTLARILFFHAPFLAAFSPDHAATSRLGGDFADPFVLRDGPSYYAFATGVGSAHLQVAQSADLQSWSQPDEALPRLPTWAAPEPGYTWAPAVLERAGSYVLYYTTRDASSGFQCISRATSTTPRGPYEDRSSRPLICQSSGPTAMCGSIDPSPFVEPDGTAYLLWKSDENGAPCHAPSRLWSQRLTDDGLDVAGSPNALIVADQTWEGRLVEGPSLWLHDGTYYLFYSANAYESASYAIGYAACASPAGPCTKRTTGAPLISSAGSVLGPGGEELFSDATGGTWMAYHAWSAPHATYAEGGARSLRLAPVRFDDRGPVVGPTLP
jgi:beta-xylosidase